MKMYYSEVSDPKSWDPPDEIIIKFPFNIEKLLRWLIKMRILKKGG